MQCSVDIDALGASVLLPSHWRHCTLINSNRFGPQCTDTTLPSLLPWALLSVGAVLPRYQHSHTDFIIVLEYISPHLPHSPIAIKCMFIAHSPRLMDYRIDFLLSYALTVALCLYAFVPLCVCSVLFICTCSTANH